MPLTINFSDPTKPAITVPDFPPGINAVDTSVALVGKGYPNYAQKFAESFVHLLENFSSPTPPANPIEGQLWYDSANRVLKIMDGTSSSVRWPNATGIYQQPTDPTASNISGLKTGDIWVDTLRNQVKVYSQNGWTLIGPCATNLSTDANGNVVATVTTTGSFPTTEIDNKIPPSEHLVIENYVNGKVISIISANSFTPKKIISGFGINPVVKGINLSTGAIINGISLAAQYLDPSITTNIQFQGADFVAAGNFLRKEDTSQLGQIVTGKLNLQNSGFLDGGLVFSSSSNAETSQIIFLEHNTKISNSAAAGTIILNIHGTDLITVSSTLTKIKNDLQVFGNQTVYGSITTTGTIASGGSLTIGGDITNQGNISSSGNLQVVGNANINGTLNVSGNVSFGAVQSQTIGTTSTSLYGNLIGNASSANELMNYTHAQLVGAVTSDEFIFNGDGTLRDKHGFNLGKSINVRLSTGAFIDLPIITDGNNTTTNLLAYDSNPDNLNPLFQLANNIFLPGMMMPYGGPRFDPVTTTPLPHPPGWLWCDGATVSIPTYPNLFAVIGYTYNPTPTAGYFQLPNMAHATAGEGILINYLIKT
jgi:cytoskeletal protein CcmA (bactofilin family)